jgi:glycosyltransferase involved in cell wall biosynthesis
MKATIIIPTHNRREKLLETLASLERQELSSAEYEIVVVDDGSTVPVVLVDGADRPGQKVVRLEGLERSAARNAGARIAKGKLLIFVDDDMRVAPGFLQAHLRAQEEWPGALVVGSIRLPEEGMTGPFRRFRECVENNGLPASRGLVPMRNFCAAGNFSIPQDRFHRIGGFDVTMRSGEDQDLALRHTAEGGSIAFAPEADALHDDSALDIRSYCKRAEWGIEHILGFIHRHPDWPDNTKRMTVNGPLSFGHEPLIQSLRKIFKLALRKAPLLALLFAAASILERIAPDTSVLDRCYGMLLGLHIFRGYRLGLAGYNQPSAPTLRWPIADVHQAAELKIQD